MNELVASLTADISSVSGGFWNWFSVNLIWFQIIGGIISLFFIWVIINSIRKSGYHYIKADIWRDKLGIKNLPLIRTRRSWKMAIRYIGTSDPAKWRLAVLEAENIIKDWLKMKPLKAEIEGLNEARNLAQDIKNNSDLEITRERAIQALRAYKKALRDWGIVGT